MLCPPSNFGSSSHWCACDWAHPREVKVCGMFAAAVEGPIDCYTLYSKRMIYEHTYTSYIYIYIEVEKDGDGERSIII